VSVNLCSSLIVGSSLVAGRGSGQPSPDLGHLAILPKADVHVKVLGFDGERGLDLVNDGAIEVRSAVHKQGIWVTTCL